MGNITFENKQAYSEDVPSPGNPPAEGDLRSSAQLIAGLKGGISKPLAWARRNQVREFWSWARCKRVTLPTVAELAESLAALQSPAAAAISAEQDVEAPIFLLANGWRAGSTLLQRILVTDPRVLLWGEPFGEMALFSGIAETLHRISGFPNLQEVFAEENLSSSKLATSWIASLYPSGNDLRASLRSLFDRWLGEPARQRGFARWGFKEVRLGATEASLLHWLYPKAKFLMLSRHPYHCYRSLADSRWHHIYYRRPDVRVDTAAPFARHWNRLAVSWSDLPVGFPSFHLKYEDLITGKVDFRRLESWLGIEVAEKTALSVFVGHTAARKRLSWYERLIIAREAGPGMRALGYSE